MTPQEIVHELDKHIIGQNAAKRAVAIALRNRWRRQQIADPLRDPERHLIGSARGVGRHDGNRELRVAEATGLVDLGGRETETRVLALHLRVVAQRDLHRVRRIHRLGQQGRHRDRRRPVIRGRHADPARRGQRLRFGNAPPGGEAGAAAEQAKPHDAQRATADVSQCHGWRSLAAGWSR